MLLYIELFSVILKWIRIIMNIIEKIKQICFVAFLFKNVIPHHRHASLTIAEILITLGIIGLLAELLIPPLAQNIQDTVLRTAFKKEYSTLFQIGTSILQENGGTFIGVVDDDNSIKNKFKEYLKYEKDCDQDASAGICWHNINEWYSADNTKQDSTYGNNRAALVLRDGSLVEFSSRSSTCNDPSYGTLMRCGLVLIDVNGFKKPNKIGKDIFSFNIFINKLSTQDTSASTNCGTSMGTGKWAGIGCAAWVIEGRDY